jgi:hypothetical protein
VGVSTCVIKYGVRYVCMYVFTGMYAVWIDYGLQYAELRRMEHWGPLASLGTRGRDREGHTLSPSAHIPDRPSFASGELPESKLRESRQFAVTWTSSYEQTAQLALFASMSSDKSPWHSCPNPRRTIARKHTPRERRTRPDASRVVTYILYILYTEKDGGNKGLRGSSQQMSCTEPTAACYWTGNLVLSQPLPHRISCPL